MDRCFMADGIRVPSALRQISFHQLLVGARKTRLIDALSEALGKIDGERLKKELVKYAPADALKILASSGIRDEHVFPTPVVLERKPTLVGYYRLLLGVPQKTFYGSGSGMGQFKSMEASGALTERQGKNLPEFCAVMGEALAELVRQISPRMTNRDVSDLTVLTLGQQFQGANNNKIGQQATREVFLAVTEIVKKFTVERMPNQVIVTNASKRKVIITLASDPDVWIEEEGRPGITHKKLALEIKGGTDRSNAHNRAGEAEKSHQKAKKQGFKDFWTLIALTGMKLDRLKEESPTTNEWFDVSHVLAREGDDWIRFREHLANVVGIPVGKTR